MLHKDLRNYMVNTIAIWSMHLIRDKENLSSNEWGNMHGGATKFLKALALLVLSRVVKTSLI